VRYWRKLSASFNYSKTLWLPLKSSIDFAFVYGSVARGEDKATSDIDLMVIGATTLDDVLDAVGPLEKQLRRAT